MKSVNNSLFSLIFTLTGNDIGLKGAMSLNEALKSNTTLTELHLNGSVHASTRFFHLLSSEVHRLVVESGGEGLSLPPNVP